ncbi:MAG TPA: hypothetical protein VHU89_10240 [Acidobacteriaceae bacterium]|jgi:hypothetical protein|nr:hypothetical protein [Acidobacteriaceae bacterium]
MLRKRIGPAVMGMFLAAPLALGAQNAKPAAPLPLAGVYYRYWPEQIVQWIGPELPYSMIVLDIDDRGKPPIYDVQLIPKTGDAMVHYTNSAQELAIDQHAGFTVHQVAMQLDGPADPSNGAQYLLRFNTETGTPVLWQFVLGTDVSEQGSGLSPTGAKIPLLMYREQGGVAGQGTALKIGNVTSVADVWKEIAQPPYFVPYRGALSVGVHVLTFAPVSSAWKEDGTTLTDGKGQSLVEAKDGDTVDLANKSLGTVESYTTAGTGISRVSFGPAGGKADHTVSLEFSPALAAGGKSSVEVVAGKKSRIAAGTVEASSAPNGGVTEAWSFSSPDGLKGSAATATVSWQK